MKHVLMLIIAIAAVCMSARAQTTGIYVEYYDNLAGWIAVPGYPNRNAIPAEPGLPSGSHISLSSVNSGFYRVFAVSPSTTDIGSITVSGSSSAVPTLFIGQPGGSFPTPNMFSPLPTAAARNLGPVSYGSPKLRVQGFIQGTLTGSMSAHEIIRFDFGTASSPGTGTIAANISHNPSANPAVTQLGGLFAKRVAPGAVITSYNSNIRVMQTYSDFEGSIQTTNGKNLQAFQVGRDFKNANVSVSGDLGTLFVARHGTGSISAGGALSVSAQILGHWGAQPVGSTPNYQSSSINVGSISTSFSVSGDFIGQLQAASISQMTVGGGFYNHLSGVNTDSPILVGGNIQTLTVGTPLLGTATGNMVDLEADSVTNIVTLAGNYVSGSALLRNGLPAGSIFRIGGTLGSGVTIELENDPLDPSDVGLKGQIVVNQSNGTGDWMGTVQINDGSTLTSLAENYTTLSTSIGNGAAGLAPFNFHQFTGPMPADPADLDCNPFHTQTIFVGNCEGDLPTLREVVIDHYGPVFASGTGDHYRVEFRPDYFPSDWENVTHLFQVDETQTATTNGGANRKVVLKTVSSAGIQASGYFRFRPLANKVKCANVSGIPDVAYDSNIVSGDLGNTSSGSQYDWYQFRMRLRVCRQTEMIIFENEQVNAADITAWIDQPFEVNMDGQVCSQDLADMLAAYNAQ